MGPTCHTPLTLSSSFSALLYLPHVFSWQQGVRAYAVANSNRSTATTRFVIGVSRQAVARRGVESWSGHTENLLVWGSVGDDDGAVEGVSGDGEYAPCRRSSSPLRVIGRRVRQEDGRTNNMHGLSSTFPTLIRRWPTPRTLNVERKGEEGRVVVTRMMGYTGSPPSPPEPVASASSDMAEWSYRASTLYSVDKTTTPLLPKHRHRG